MVFLDFLSVFAYTFAEVIIMTSLGNKDVMAKNIVKYMELNHEDRRMLCAAIGEPYTTVTNWIKAASYPRIDKIEKMAMHWGISKSDLIEDEKTPTAADERLAKMNDIFAMLSEEQQERELVYLQSLLNAKDR